MEVAFIAILFSVIQLFGEHVHSIYEVPLYWLGLHIVPDEH
jgi:hypothetical protein